MAPPTQRVQAVKQESTAGGGDPTDNLLTTPQAPIDETEDALSAAGMAFQPVGGPGQDLLALFWRESNDIWLKDPNTPAERLQDLVNYLAFHLRNGPVITSSADVTITNGVIVSMRWRRPDTTILIQTTFTRTSGLISATSVEVRATDGTTVLAKLDTTYTRTNGRITSASQTRSV